MDKLFRLIFIFTLVLPILGQKWIKKRPDLIFLESQDNLILFSDNLHKNWVPLPQKYWQEANFRFLSALKFLAQYSSQSQSSNFLRKSRKKLIEIIENQRETKNPSRGKIFRPPYILPFFLPFLRQKWIEKGSNLIFLECWDSELMSLMIWQKNIFFPSKMWWK